MPSDDLDSHIWSDDEEEKDVDLNTCIPLRMILDSQINLISHLRSRIVNASSGKNKNEFYILFAHYHDTMSSSNQQRQQRSP